MTYKIHVFFRGIRWYSLEPDISFNHIDAAQKHIDELTEHGFDTRMHEEVTFKIVEISSLNMYCAGCHTKFKIVDRLSVLTPALINQAGCILIDAAADRDLYFCEECRDLLEVNRPKSLGQPASMVLGHIVTNCKYMPCRVSTQNLDRNSLCIMGGGCGEDVLQRYGITVGMQILRRVMDRYDTSLDFETMVDVAAFDIVGA